MYNDWIDDNDIYTELYSDYAEEITKDIADKYEDRRNDGDIDFEELIDEAVRENISECDLESKIDDMWDNLYSDDYDEIVNNYGIESAVNGYMQEECITVGWFDVKDCAKWCMEQECDDYDYESLVSDIVCAISEEYGDSDDETAVKKIWEEYYPQKYKDIPEELHPVVDKIERVRELNPESLVNITIGMVDELVCVGKFVTENYCQVTCKRCPVFTENCTDNDKDAFKFEVYSKLFNKFTFTEFWIMVELLKYYMGEKDLGIKELAEELKKFNINMDMSPDKLKHSFKD